MLSPGVLLLHQGKNLPVLVHRTLRNYHTSKLEVQ